MATEEPTVVSTAFLRGAFEALIGHIEETHGDTLRLDQDYFWSVPPREIYDVTKQPTELTIGQLTESLDFLRNQIDDPDGQVSWGMVWLGDVLKAVGHELIG